VTFAEIVYDEADKVDEAFTAWHIGLITVGAVIFISVSLLMYVYALQYSIIYHSKTNK